MKEEKMKRDKEIKRFEILKVLKVEEKPSAPCPDSLSNEDTIKLSEKKILWFLWWEKFKIQSKLPTKHEISISIISHNFKYLTLFGSGYYEETFSYQIWIKLMNVI